MKHLLFVCTKNKWRSPTAEHLYQNYSHVIARSRDTSKAAHKVITVNDIIWSDVIFVMENKHKKFIIDQFRSFTNSQNIIVLDIPDEYRYIDKDLVEWLLASVDSYLLTI